MSLYDDLENTTTENTVPENEEVVEGSADVSTEAVAETVEEATEEAAEAAEDSEFFDVSEDTAGEAYDEISDEQQGEPSVGEGEENAQEFAEGLESDVDTKKKSSGSIVALLVIIAVIIIGLIVYIFGFKKSSNPYNNMGYINPNGRTVADVAEEMGVSLEEFLAQFGLPEDMPADTEEMAAFYTMPFKNIASMYGADVPTLKEQLQIPDETTVSEPKNLKEKIKSIFKPEKPVEITEDTPWGIVEGEITVGNYYGEDYVDEFKEYYGFGDEVTADTKLKDIRDELNKKTLEMMAEDKAALEEEEKEDAEATEEEEGSSEAPDGVEGVVEEAPADEDTGATEAE